MTAKILPSPLLVILNLFQDNKPPPPFILKQVQDDEILGVEGRAQSVSATRSQANQPGPLPHATHGPPPRFGEE
jgi:hypothetical protein